MSRGLLDETRLCPWESSFPMAVSFCLCSLHVLHPLQQLPYLPELSPPLTWQPQLFFPVLAGIWQHPTYPIPATLSSKPKLFPTPESIIHFTSTTTQTTLHSHHPTHLPALPSTLTRSFAAPKTPIPPFSPHCSLSIHSSH